MLPPPKFVIRLQFIRQLLKFSIVGFLNVAVSFLIFYLCYERWQTGSLILVAVGAVGKNFAETLHQLGVPSLNAAFANVAGYLTGMISSFLLNKTWTFGTRHTSMTQVWRFVAVSAFGLTCSTLALFIFVDLLEKPYLPTWFVTTSAIMILNFLGTKYWAFSENGFRMPDIESFSKRQGHRQRQWR
jgi:putative flippase GtrA